MSDGSVSVLEHFLSACEAWNLDEVHRVVDSGFNVDAFDDDHVTGLQMAAATGNIGIVEYLVDSGADIEKSNQVGMTPLHHACRNGHTNVVRILVQRGANYQKLTYLGASSMTLAAAGGHIELVKLLLDLRVSVNPSHTALCPTPIIASAFRRHTHICALLTHRGAYVDGHIQRLWNLSALSTAISCGATSVVSALLELGANASFRSLGGRTAIELASALNREDALDVIKTALRSTVKDEKPKEVDLRERILARDEVAVRVALRRGTTCTTFAEGCTALMYAILLADIALVKAILEENTNVDAADNVSGLTALMLAAIVGDSEIIECLLNAGADASLTSFEGLTALDYALTSGMFDAEVLCLLQRHLEHGCMPPAKNEIHQQLSRVIHTGKSKILNKISTHVGLSVSLGSIERKETTWLPREHFGRLLRAASDGTQAEFVLASDMLRSIGHHGRPIKDDPLQSCVRIARYVAEQRAAHGFAPLPIAFIGEESQCENSMSAKYGNSIDSSISGKSQCSERQKEYFSLAQRNADLFYEYRFPKGESKRGKMGNLKTKLLFDDENRRKISSSTSASGSEDKSPPRAQGYSFFERGSTSTLGTTPRVRMRSRETLTLDDDEKSSPSRLSLNQYTFALKDDKTTLRKSTSSPMLGTMICRSSSANCFKVTNSARNSARSAVSSFEHAHRHRHHTDTEDSLWMRLRGAGLGAYVDLLKAEEVDKATFVALTNDDLMHLGITNTLHRQILLKIAKAIRHK